MITPFNKDESINFKGIKEVTKFLAENGVTGIIPSGSTGEMIALSKDEQIAINRAYIEAGHEYGIKVVASTGAYRTKDVVEMSQAADADGADGIMAVTPWYMKSNEGKSLEEISEKTGYHISTASKLIARYMRDGISAIAENHYKGNRRNMSFEEEAAILAPFIERA